MAGAATKARTAAVAVSEEQIEQQEGPATMTGGGRLEEIIDETSLRGQIAKASEQNRAQARPFRQYQKRVIEKAGVPNTHQTRQITSNVCGIVARLPFVPDDAVTIQDDRGHDTTEFEQQVIRTAAQAESMLGSETVWTVSARKLARAALELRKEDPDGSKGIAWVNDTREDEAHVLDD